MKQQAKLKQDNNNSEELKKIVLERLKSMPESLSVSIGNAEYTTDELVGHVEDGDEVGKQIMEIQLQYLQDLGSGKIYDNE